MASEFKNIASVLIALFSFCQLANTMEFEVGGDNGWQVPKKDEAYYNQWASENRFNVNDTLHFKYEKDSVMVVTEDEYKECKSGRPIFYGNKGDTVVMLNHPGLFYFISGVAGHCDKGQKMIIKVLDTQSLGRNHNSTDTVKNDNGTVTNNFALSENSRASHLALFFIVAYLFV